MKRNTLSCSITHLRYAAIAALLLLLPASGIMAQDSTVKPLLDGEGTEESPFVIHDLNELNKVAEYYGNYPGEGACHVWHFKLVHDINIIYAGSEAQTYQRFTDINGDIIDYGETGEYRNEFMSDYSETDESYSPNNPFNLYTPNPRPFTPIGTADHPFNGVFDGGGRTIANLYFHAVTTETRTGSDGNTHNYDVVGNVIQDNSGLFGYCEDARISNLGVVDSYIEGNNVAAAICANARNTALEQVYSASTVVATPVQAALIGNAEGTVSLTNCYNVGRVGTDGKNPLVGIVAADATVTYSGCYTLGEKCSSAEGLTVASKTAAPAASDMGEAYIDGLNGHPILKAVSYPLATKADWNYGAGTVNEGGLVSYADASLFVPTDNTPYLIYADKGENDVSYFQNIAFLHNMFYSDMPSFCFDYANKKIGHINNNVYSWYLTDKKNLDKQAFDDLLVSSFTPKEIFYHRDNTEGYNSVCLPFEFRPSHFRPGKIIGADGKEHYNVEMLSFTDDCGYDVSGNQMLYEGETGNGRNGVFNFGYVYTPKFTFQSYWGAPITILDKTTVNTNGKALLVNTPGVTEWNMHIIYNTSNSIYSSDGFFEYVNLNYGYPQQNPKGVWTECYKEPFKSSYYDEEYNYIELPAVYPYRTFHLGTFEMIEKLADYSSWSGQPAGTDDMTFIQDNYLAYKLAVVNGETKFVKAADRSGVYPFRTFIICPDFAKLGNKPEENYSRMTILAHAGGTVTGIGCIDEDGKVKITPVSDVYSLDGRLVRKGGVSGKSPFDGLAPGIYVSGGKKIVIGR